MPILAVHLNRLAVLNNAEVLRVRNPSPIDTHARSPNVSRHFLNITPMTIHCSTRDFCLRTHCRLCLQLTVTGEVVHSLQQKHVHDVVEDLAEVL